MKFNREQFVNDLRYLATLNCPWRHQGTSPTMGMDCIGVLRWAYERQGLKLPDGLTDEWYYRRPPDGFRMLSLMRTWFQEISIEETTPSDLIVLFVGKNPCHVTAKVSDTDIAEAFEGGKTSKFLIRPFNTRHRKVAACFRIPDFA
jgi:hypothetical protein